ncbi:hypothetical protein ABI59_11620 [Acidobacteria bacterium Mor1]|nr:hypothetical protein ABI59_11620 [Acidobacteria bacterium Mor1]
MRTSGARGFPTTCRGRAEVLMLLAAAFVSVCGVPSNAAGEPESSDALTVSLDPYLSVESGADLTFSLVSLTARAEAWAFRPLEDRPAARVPLRSFWALAFDVPVAWWFGVLQHEAYGHAGRARELGSSGAGARMGSPWKRRSSYATFDASGMSDVDLLRVYAAGPESNGHAATLLTREALAGRELRPMELFYLTANRAVTSRYVLRTTPDPVTEPGGFFAEWSGGGDVANYIGYLHRDRFGDEGIRADGVDPSVLDVYERMERHAYWNGLDPAAWLALAVGWRAVVRGESTAQLPGFRLAGRRTLPVLSADWLPRGPVASLELVFGQPLPGSDHAGGSGGARGSAASGSRSAAAWYSLVVRHGRGFDGRIGAVGAATEAFAEAGVFRLGGDLEIWDRPDGGVGGGVRVRGRVVRGRFRGAFADIGVKTAGHWPGRPVDDGPFVRFGVRFVP